VTVAAFKGFSFLNGEIVCNPHDTNLYHTHDTNLYHIHLCIYSEAKFLNDTSYSFGIVQQK